MTTPTRRPWQIRGEQPGDERGIAAVNAVAFGRAEEADLVGRLRADHDAWLEGLSLVAEERGRIVGHVLVSRVMVEGPHGGAAASLAPMAVLPEVQGRGIGTDLVEAAVHRARQAGETVMVVLGHAAYYPRFGFAPARPQGLLAPWPVDDAYWMALDLSGRGEHPRGTVTYPRAFEGV